VLISSHTLLEAAREGGYAVGGFNVYNLEGVRATLAAAEAEQSSVILQIHPAALRYGGAPFIALCQVAAREAAVPVSVHLDHSSSPEDIRHALAAGITSIMVDGSHLPYERNMMFTRNLAGLAHEHGAMVEAELGRLSGTEDGLTVAAYEAALTDPEEAARFVNQTGADALAVCIGNVHGVYRDEPQLDLVRLALIRQAVSIPLVLHGASGLPDRLVRIAIELGVAKFNVNTEVREAYLRVLHDQLRMEARPELIPLMEQASDAMQAVVAAKLQLFGSAGRAASYSPLT
jgi:tagatose 1,6-diphosphate aldolase GatY/KbaY